MKIDWSKAPEGAEEAGVGPCGDARWYRGVTGQEYSVWSSTTSKWNGFNGKPSIKTRERRPVGPNNGIDWSLAPEGAEEASVHQSGDVRWYKDITDGCCSVWLSRTLEWHGLDGTPSLRGREKRPVEDVDVSYSAIESDLTPTTGTDQQPDSGAVSIVRKVGERDPENKYMREILPGIWIDVYHLLDAFKTDSAAVDHAVKKCVAPGQRGVKDRIQDLEEARDSLNRAIEDAKMWEAAK